MPRVVDLTGPIEPGLWGYHQLPGLETLLPPVELEPISSVAEHGFFASRLRLTTISGTYVESGAHMLEDGRLLDTYDVADFIRPARLLRLPAQPPRAAVSAELLARHDPDLAPGEALVLDTGWGARWNSPGYVAECPTLAPDALGWILERRPGILAVDVPCLESAWSEEREEDKGELLKALFRAGLLLVAPLLNLDRIVSSRGQLVCLPLSLRGTSGAPARVVYLEAE